MTDLAKRYSKENSGRSPFLLTSRIHKLFAVELEVTTELEKCITVAVGVDELARQELMKHVLVGKAPRGTSPLPQQQDICPFYSTDNVDIPFDEWQPHNVKGE
jgi:hypothetical protein